MSTYFATVTDSKDKVISKVDSHTEAWLSKKLNDIFSEYPADETVVVITEVDDNGTEVKRTTLNGRTIDFNNYEDTIRKAVKKENDNDPNWGWSVKSISKDTVRISWGYLKDMNGENDSFLLKLRPYFMVDFSEPASHMLEAFHPENIGGRISYEFVTDKTVDELDVTCIDVPIAEGIEKMIHRVAVYAHNCY